MKAETVKQAGEIAAEFIYHYLYDLGSVARECVDAAKEIYAEITDEELNVEEFFGLTDEVIDLDGEEEVFYPF